MFSANWIADGMVQEMRWIPVQERWGGKVLLARARLGFEGKDTRRGSELVRQLGRRLAAWGQGLERSGLPNSSNVGLIL